MHEEDRGSHSRARTHWHAVAALRREADTMRPETLARRNLITDIHPPLTARSLISFTLCTGMTPSGLTGRLSKPGGQQEVLQMVADFVRYLAGFTGVMHLVVPDARSAPVIVRLDLSE